jgi:metal-responsive CopG/Arc/MetJ family transcriptional regulator
MAAKTRINISMDQATLRLADRLARRKKISRSEILRKGVQSLADADQREFEEVAVREQRRKAIAGIREIARKMGDWPAEQIVHDWRYRLKEKEK